MSIKPHPTKGPGWWQIRISHGRRGKDEYQTYQGTEAEALAFEADLRGIPQQADQQRLLDVIGRYLDWADSNLAARTVKDREATLPRIIERIGNKHLSLLRQADYDRYKRQRLGDGVSKRTINIELTMLRGLLTYAKDELKIPTGDLPKMYPKKQTAPPQRIVYTPDEINRLLDELHGDKKTIVQLYAWCGLRRNEALTLTRGMIDLDAGMLYITGKGDKGRVVPIVGQELLQRLKQQCKNKKQGDLLFPNRKGKPYTTIIKGLKAAAKRAKIEKPIWNHLMRHSGATAAISAGVNLRSLQAILGHSDIRMTEIYTHMAGDLLKAEAQKMDNYNRSSKGVGNVGNKKSKKNNVFQIDRKQRS